MRNSFSFSFAVCNAKAQGEEDKPIAPAQGHSPCQPSEDSEGTLFHGSQALILQYILQVFAVRPGSLAPNELRR